MLACWAVNHEVVEGSNTQLVCLTYMRQWEREPMTHWHMSELRTVMLPLVTGAQGCLSLYHTPCSYSSLPHLSKKHYVMCLNAWMQKTQAYWVRTKCIWDVVQSAIMLPWPWRGRGGFQEKPINTGVPVKLDAVLARQSEIFWICF